MNPEQFRDSTTGRLMKVGRGEAAYWAFLPNPLPPALELDEDLLKRIAAADGALGELAELARATADITLFSGLFVRGEAVFSCRVEGLQAEIGDVYAYQAGRFPLSEFSFAAPEIDVRQVHNYALALEYAAERLESFPLSLRLLRELHEFVVDGLDEKRFTPGEFRRSQNWIGPPGALLNEALFVPPPVHEMHAALDALEKYLHADDDNPPLVRLALIYYQFETIHSFIDGNGRVGRLLLSILLEQWGLLPAPLLILSGYFDLFGRRHHELLLAVRERSEWREWIVFFLHGVLEQARSSAAWLRKLVALRDGWREQLRQDGLLDEGAELLDSLFRQPIIVLDKESGGSSLPAEGTKGLLRQFAARRIVEEVKNPDVDIYQAAAILRIVGP